MEVPTNQAARPSLLDRCQRLLPQKHRNIAAKLSVIGTPAWGGGGGPITYP